MALRRKYPSRKLSSRFSIEKARKLQSMLSRRVIVEDLLQPNLRYVAGIDVAYTGETAVAAIAVLDYDTMDVVEVKTDRVREQFPYIPTLLSFREAPAIFKVLPKLRSKPDIYLIDGQGLAHPYRCGLATHVGVAATIPTIGVAKSRLCGNVGAYSDDWAPITDDDEVIGAALITRRGKKPVYVSIGHMVSLKRAIEVVRHCATRYRVPEPIRTAHKTVTRERLTLLGN